ncbi:MAG: MarR family transcriptional regulator, partial [Clostridia bacterium]|nr:MarR family transcriptional regulator [Clostridia bacterium]
MRRTTEDYLKTIRLIREREGRVRSIALAEAFGVSKPTVCKIVKRLIADGYITKDGNNEIML